MRTSLVLWLINLVIFQNMVVSMRLFSLNMRQSTSPSILFKQVFKSRPFSSSSSLKPEKIVYPILVYPDPRLRAENEEVTEFTDELKEICKNLLHTMYHSEGVGLAAPQVGINKKILVLNPAGHPKKKRSEKVMINPVILKHSDDLVSINEGCLSFPTIYADIPRYQWVEVLYQNIHGEKHVSKFKDFDSILVQHEMDHLEQILFIDKFEAEDKYLNQELLSEFEYVYNTAMESEEKLKKGNN